METIEFNACPLGPFFDLDGKPVSGGRLWLLDSATSVPETAYTDRAGTVASENPAPLGGDGCLEQQLWLRKGVSYAMRLYKPTSASSVYDPGDFPNADWALVRTWLQESEEDAPTSAVLTVDTIADLKALDPSTVDGMAVEVLGYYAKGDCVARTYLWTAGAFSEADNGAVVSSPAYSGTDAWVLASATGDDISSAIWGDVVGQPDNAFPSIAATAENWCLANGKRLVLEPGVRKVNAASIAFSGPVILEDGFRLAVLDSGTVTLTFSGADTEIRPTSNLLYGLGGTVNVQTLGAFRGVIHSNLVEWSIPANFSDRTTVVLDGNVNPAANTTIPVLDANGYTITGGNTSFVVGKILREPGDAAAVDSSGATIYVLSDFRASDLTAAAFAALAAPDVKITVDEDRALSGTVSWPGATLETAGGKLSGYTKLTVGNIVGQTAVFAANNVECAGGLRVWHFATLDGNALNSLLGSSRGVVDGEGGTFTLNGLESIPGGTFKNIIITGSGSISITGAIRFISSSITATEVRFCISGGDYTFELVDSALKTTGSFVLGESTTCWLRNSTVDAGAWAPALSANYQQMLDAEGCYFPNAIDPGNGSVRLVNCRFDQVVRLRGTCSDVVIKGCHSTATSATGVILDYSTSTATPPGNFVDITGEVDISGNTPCPVHDGSDGFDATAPRWPQTEGDIVTTNGSGVTSFNTSWGVFVAHPDGNLTPILGHGAAQCGSNTLGAVEGHLQMVTGSGLTIIGSSSFGTETKYIHFKLFR